MVTILLTSNVEYTKVSPAPPNSHIGRPHLPTLQVGCYLRLGAGSTHEKIEPGET